MRHDTSGRPALEHELMRNPELGFEPAGTSAVRCLEHGAPWPLERWHFHDECELQLITKTVRADLNLSHRAEP